MHNRSSFFIATAAFGLLVSTPALAVSVTVTVDNATPIIGDLVTFTYVMDFSDDSTIGGGTDFFYDPNVLQYQGWQFDSELMADEAFFRRAPTNCADTNSDAGCTFDADQFGPGLAQANGLAWGQSAGSGVAGPLLIGRMTFTAVGAGFTTLLMAANDDGVAGNPGPFVSGNSFQIQTVNFFGDAVTVSGGAVDSDGDGVFDSADNCTERANPAQRDSDGDGIGNFCDADLNGDCIVNVVDLGVFRARFFTTDPDADFDGNGVVNAGDLGILRTLFFRPPGPSGIANICAPR